VADDFETQFEICPVPKKINLLSACLFMGESAVFEIFDGLPLQGPGSN